MGQTGLDAKKGAEILSTVLGTYTLDRPVSEDADRQNLRGIAQVKLGNLGTRVFYTSIGGFDTHASQLRFTRALERCLRVRGGVLRGPAGA